MRYIPLLIILLIVLTGCVSTQTIEKTPEEVVEEYLIYIENEDYESARTLLDPESEANLEYDFNQVGKGFRKILIFTYGDNVFEAMSFKLEESTEDTAKVGTYIDKSLTEINKDVGTYNDSEQQWSTNLVKVNGQWLIS